MNKHEYVSIENLGKLFGVTSRVCGRWLADLGLREVGKNPKTKAFELDLVIKAPTGKGSGYFYIWNLPKTFAILVEAGHKPVVWSSSRSDGGSTKQRLKRPIQVEQSGPCWSVVNGDDETILIAFDHAIAARVAGGLSKRQTR